jgi:hypothetical protein
MNLALASGSLIVGERTEISPDAYTDYSTLNP